MKEHHKVVGVLAQIRILLWKNRLLFQRNTAGTLAEILAALVFALILLLLRFFVDSAQFFDQNATSTVSRSILSNVNTSTNRSLIMFYPNNAFVQTIVTNAYTAIQSQSSKFNATIVPSPYSDASNLDSTTVSNLFALVSFPDNYTSLASLPSNIQYTIQTQETASNQYNILSNFVSLSSYMYSNSPENFCFSTTYFALYRTIFDPIKHAVDIAITNAITGALTILPSQVKIVQFFCPSYDNDIYKTRFSFFPVIIIQISFLFTLVVSVGNIILEKESKMKEYLKLCGIKWYIIWITWFIRSVIPYIILSVILTLLCSVKLDPRISSVVTNSSVSMNVQKSVFLNTNPFLGFCVFLVYSVQTAMFTLLIGQIFSQTFVAKIFVILFWIITAINFYDSLPSGAKYFFCLFPNAGLLFAFQIIFQYERSGESLGFPQLYKNLYNDPLNLGVILLIMIIWTVVYIPVTWYIERIFPGDYGAPLPFYFPFMPSYWRDPSQTDQVNVEFNRIRDTEEFGFEKDPPNLNCSISIRHLNKEFTYGFNKKKKVVDDLSINFYENQITGLLGHNGAGKTTTTFMLCGIYAPTSGDAFILGKNIRTHMNEIRSSLGFCPQHDILYNELTVAEHLDLIASIKGYEKSEIKEEIAEISKLVGLHNDLEKKAKQLSGGMKRRLSVAMALTGGSKIIILDEPTSGLDPYNRRCLWDLVRKFKEGRSIVLTTHFMEEADALSDRIAIMNHGQVKCCGSPIFLKNSYGSGYRLTISKNPKFDLNKFEFILDNLIEKHTIESNISAEISVTIPFELNHKLAQLLNDLEANKSLYGIDGYGVSSPSIEEVFIKVGSIDVADYDPNKVEETHIKDKAKAKQFEMINAFSQDFEKYSGCYFILQQLWSLLIKRFRIFYRRYILAALILLLPFLLEAVLSSIIPSSTNLINSITGRVQSLGQYQLAMQTYKTSQTLPYFLNSTTYPASATTTQTLLNSLYSSSSLVSLLQIGADMVNDYILSLRKLDLNNLIYQYYAGMSLNFRASNSLAGTLYFSTLAYHSPGNILNDFDSLMLEVATNDPTRSISTINKPLASNNSLGGSSSFLEVLACIDSLPLSLLDFINAIIVALMISFMVIHVGRERSNGSKQLQFLTGTHYATYWLSNYIFDLAIYTFCVSTMMFALKIVNSARNDTTSELYPIASDNTLGYAYLLFLVSMFSWCSYAYIWSFIFKSEIIGFVVLAIFLGFMAFLDVVWIFLQLLLQNGSTTQTGGSKLIQGIRYLFALLFPNVNIKRGLYNLKIKGNSYCIDNVNQYLALNFQANLDPLSINEPGIGLMLVFALVQFVVSTAILLIKEQRLFAGMCSCCQSEQSAITPETDLESDVEAEANRIRNSDIMSLSKTEPLVVHNLLRRFKKGPINFVAVNNLSFSVRRQECFGLLGLNGAGKSTTFKILTGELDATSGSAFINGCDIKQQQFAARQNLSFCPQFDYLPEYLTVQETFQLFAGLRAIEKTASKKCLAELLSVFKLNEFSDKFVQKLSGGNKRKVSAAISFIGRPSVVILDEPTTGMDPAARRYLWTVIKQARDSGMTIVLTTHSMDECEALSDRLGIMVNGQFQCLGSVQHLKNKYGKGYTLIIKCKHSETATSYQNVIDFVRNSIRFARLKDQQQETLFFQVSKDEGNVSKEELQSISDLFDLLERNKNGLGIETYSLSQTSLEQIFLSFARHQKDEQTLIAEAEQIRELQQQQNQLTPVEDIQE